MMTRIGHTWRQQWFVLSLVLVLSIGGIVQFVQAATTPCTLIDRWLGASGCLHRVIVPTLAVQAVALDPAHALLAVAGARRGPTYHLRVQTIAGDVRWQITIPEPLETLRFSPDGHFLVGGGFRGAVVVWQTIDGRVVQRLPTDGGTTFAFSADGMVVGVNAQRWHIARGTVVSPTMATPLVPASGWGLAYALAPNRTAVVNWQHDPQTSAPTRLVVQTIATSTTTALVRPPALDLAEADVWYWHWDPTSRFILADYKTFTTDPIASHVIVWRASDGQVIRMLTTSEMIETIAWAEDGTQFAVGSAGGYDGRIDIYRAVP